MPCFIFFYAAANAARLVGVVMNFDFLFYIVWQQCFVCCSAV
jgi:hypothetical protein